MQTTQIFTISICFIKTWRVHCLALLLLRAVSLSVCCPSSSSHVYIMFCMAHCTLWKFQWLFLHILTACFCSSFQSVKLSFNAPLWEYQGSRAAFLLLLVYLQKHLHHSIYVCGIMNVNASRFYKKFSNVSWMWSHQMKNLVSFVLLSLILKKSLWGKKLICCLNLLMLFFFSNILPDCKKGKKILKHTYRDIIIH